MRQRDFNKISAFLLAGSIMLSGQVSIRAYAQEDLENTIITTYEQLQEAINAGDDEIELQIGDIELNQPITISAGKKVTLTGDGIITKAIEASSLSCFIEVQEGGELTLKSHIEVNGGGAAITGISVNKGTLIFKDQVSITEFASDNWTENPVKVEGGTFVMEGGSIHHNALDGTSTVKIDNGEMQMIAGSINNNTSYDYTPGLYLDHGKMVMGDGHSQPIIAHNVLTGGSCIGGGISINASEFTMYSGKVEGNKGVNGGGIGVHYGDGTHKTEIIKGTISNNWAIMGGGMHITEGGSSASLKNAAIYQNKTFAYGSHDNGGGVWFCPQGEGRFYTTSGSIISGNTAGNAGDDITIDDLGIMPGPSDPSHREGSVKLSSRTFTGIPISWYKDEVNQRYREGNEEEAQESYYDGSQRAELHGQIKGDQSMDALLSKADVRIYGNEAAIGGGISCNGLLTIGEKEKDITINVLKRWNDSGNEDKRPAGVVIMLLQNGKELDSAVLSEDNDWEAAFEELPAYDHNGEEYRYEIKEEISGDYESKQTVIKDNTTINITLENKYEETLPEETTPVETEPEKTTPVEIPPIETEPEKTPPEETPLEETSTGETTKPGNLQTIPATNGENPTNKPNADIPQTGDKSNMMLWLGMLMVSVCLIGIAVYSKIKNK